MKPGESRIVREEPCPPEQMHRGNQYWQLRRAAERLWEGRFQYFWTHPAELKELFDSITLLREVADTHPGKPHKAWEKYQLGTPMTETSREKPLVTGRDWYFFCANCADPTNFNKRIVDYSSNLAICSEECRKAVELEYAKMIVRPR